MGFAINLTPYVKAGTAITNAYGTTGASPPFQPGRATRVRFAVHAVTASGSSLTTITVKLQHRYNDGTNVGGYVDLPSTLDDVQGAAQPKGSTFELEHAFTVSANGTFDFTFCLDKPTALSDVTLNMHANAAGIAGDSVTVYGTAEA